MVGNAQMRGQRVTAVYPRSLMTSDRQRVVLVSEARGEFLMVERMRTQLRVLGRESLHVTARAGDANADELEASGAIVLERHPAYAAAQRLEGADLASALDRAEREIGNVNLRRVWQADLRSWREHRPDEELARAAVGYVDAWTEVLGAAAPFAGIWGEEGGHLAKRTGFLVAARRGVRVWFVIFLPLPGRLLVLEDPLYRIDCNELDATEPDADERAYATRLIASVRDSEIQFATPRSLAFGLAKVVRFARLVGRRALSNEPGAKFLHPLTFARLYVRQRTVASVLKRAHEPLGDAPFVFYPIHYRTDAQITIRAPQWENQLALIELLADALPYGHELAIKEHPFEPGGMPAAALLALLRRKPRIRLLRPTIHSHEILRRAAALATVNSTVGYEALFLGVPLVTLGNSPYRGLGLGHDVCDPFFLPQALWNAVHGAPAEDERVIRFVTLLHRRSFPGRPLGYDLSDENIRDYANMFDELARR